MYFNQAILFVPQQEAWVNNNYFTLYKRANPSMNFNNMMIIDSYKVVERMGKFHQILKPGLNFLIPILDNIKYVQSLKEIAIDGKLNSF